MPRKAAKLLKTDLDKMLKQARKDPSHSEIRADGGCDGLNVQAREGRLIFKYRFLSPETGKRRTKTLGTYPEITLAQAQAEADELRKKVVGAKVDPLELEDQKKAEERERVTVAEAAALYLDDLKHRAETGAGKRGKPSGYNSMRRLLEYHVLPRLGRKQVRELAVKEVHAWHRATKPLTQANRALTALSAVFGFLIRRGDLPPGGNPCAYVERHRETGRRRALTAPELEALGEALARAEKAGEGHPSALLAIRFLSLTGFRAGELLGHGSKPRRGDGRQGLRWEDVDLDRQLVFLTDSKTGRQVRVIGRAAVELLRAAKPADAEPHHCICPGAMRPDKPLVGIGKVRTRLFKVAGIKATPEGRADMHSLRHSFASVGAHLQASRYAGAVSALLGHGAGVARSITRQYIDEDPVALVPAADAIAEELARLLGLTEPAKVLQHPAAKGARDGARK